MIDIENVKNRILELAYQGQLVPRDISEGTAKDIIDDMPNPSVKRKRLLAEGRSDELYELPDSWAWVRLGIISSYGDTPNKVMANNAEPSTWILELEDIEAGGKLIKKSRVGGKSSIGEKTSFKGGQVLYSKLRPYLKKALIADEDGICTPELIAFDTFEGVDPKYVMRYLISPYVDKLINQRSYGIKMPRVDAGFMVNLSVPLPPLKEQERITKSIDKIFDALGVIDDLQKQYVNDREVLKRKLIDAGIQGKLTEQLPEDGTAEELYRQIQEEKKQLEKEGKIKKSKKLPEIKTEEIPYEIPANWKWVRIVDIGDWGAGATPSRKNPAYYSNGTIPWVKTGDLCDDYLSDTPEKITEAALKESSVRINPPGSVLMAMYGATIGKLGILNISATTNQACCACIPYSGVYNLYLFYYLMGERQNFIFKGHGGAQPNISKDIIVNSLIALPPYDEQKRIVDILSSLMRDVEKETSYEKSSLN